MTRRGALLHAGSFCCRMLCPRRWTSAAPRCAGCLHDLRFPDRRTVDRLTKVGPLLLLDRGNVNRSALDGRLVQGLDDPYVRQTLIAVGLGLAVLADAAAQLNQERSELVFALERPLSRLAVD